MKVTPRIQKFMGGGKYDSSFTIFEPVARPSYGDQSSSRGSGSRSKKDKDSDRGDLTEKDFFSMIKDIDGLPMEMLSIVKSLQDHLRLAELTGASQEDIAVQYINNLYKIKIAADNKEKFKQAKAEAEKNGAWGEPAIAMNGDLVAQDAETGELTTVDLRSYMQNRDAYKILSVAQLGYLREWDPRLNGNQEAFNVMRNSMGYESFQALLKEAIGTLGKSTNSYTGLFTNEGKASKGLEILQNLSQDDLNKIDSSGSVLQGLYEYVITDTTQANQIEALANYLVNALPQRARTWASLKTGNPNSGQALKDFVVASLLPGGSESHTLKTNYKGSIDKVTGTKADGSKQQDANMGFWAQVQIDSGGTPSTLNFLVDKGSMSTEGKFYGTTPGLDKDQSLSEYLAKSGIAHIRDTNSITFGDVKLSTDSYNDVMIKAGSGAYVVTLPVKDGKVWLEVIKTYENFKDQLKGLEEGSQAYFNKVKELLNEPEYIALGPILESDGKLKPSNSRHFLVLEGLASSRTAGIKDGQKTGFDDIDSDFIISAGDDAELFRTIEAGLSNKERGQYKLDNNVIWWNNDKIYRGNIYIPLNTSAISAANADKTKLKESTVYRYEGYEQDWQKTNSQGSTSAKALW